MSSYGGNYIKVKGQVTSHVRTYTSTSSPERQVEDSQDTNYGHQAFTRAINCTLGPLHSAASGFSECTLPHSLTLIYGL